LGSSTPTNDIPTSWSSIAELLGEKTDDSSSTFSSVTSIQRAFDDSREQAPLDWQESNSWESIIPESSRSSDSSSSFNQETPIQRFTTEQAPPHEEVSSAEHPSKQEDSKNEDSNSLEMLALEIYGLVRQRLEIERERHGNYYSDRLPW
jgi:predicted Mrr-cat superfamily restriction endonuclease